MEGKGKEGRKEKRGKEGKGGMADIHVDSGFLFRKCDDLVKEVLTSVRYS